MTFWVKWRVVIILGALLAGSLSGNAWLVVDKIQTAEQHKLALRIARTEAELDLAKDTLGKIATMGAQAAKDGEKLQGLLQAARETPAQAVTRYERTVGGQTRGCRAAPKQIKGVNEVLHGK